MNIAIIGLSGIYPGADSPERFHERLLKGEDCIREVPASRRACLNLLPDVRYQEIGFLDRIEYFDHRFFNISSKEADEMSPEQRLSLELAADAVLDAGYALSTFKGSRCGVFMAAQDNEYYDKLSKKSGLSWIGSMKSMLAGKVAYHLDLHGPNMVIDTGCSSALVCLEDACRRLEAGDIDYALVGGVTVYLNFGARNTDGDLLGIEAGNGRCKPFDASADGIGVGEGGGFVLLKRQAEAERDLNHIYGTVRAAAINSDGQRCSSLTTPGIEGQKEVILAAWRSGGIDPARITELEAHGTGTRLGDPIEVASFNESFEAAGVCRTGHRVYLSSVKGNIGHLNATAGMAGLTKILLGFRHHVIYPICHFKTPNPLIDFEDSALIPVSEVIRTDHFRHRLAAVNSFGLSGTNAHAIIEAPLPSQSDAPDQSGDGQPESGQTVIKLSARNWDSLRRYASEVAEHIERHGVSRDLCYTLNTGRDDYECRMAVTGDSADRLICELRAISESGSLTGSDLNSLLVLQSCDAAHRKIVSERLERFGIRPEYQLTDEGMETAPEDILIDEINRLNRGQKLIVIWFGPYGGTACDARICRFGEPADEAELLCALYTAGVDIRWSACFERPHRTVSAPTYCFERVYHWGAMMAPGTSVATIQPADAPAAQPVPLAAQSDQDPGAILKSIWIRVLECEPEEVTGKTDFFDLGGNSLMSSLLVDEIKNSFGVEIFVDEIYDYGTPDDQLLLIQERLNECVDTPGGSDRDQDAGREAEASGTPSADGGPDADSAEGCALLPMQRRILTSIRRRPERSGWILSFTFKVTGQIDAERMAAAYETVCRSHEQFSSRLVSRDGRNWFERTDTAVGKAEIVRPTGVDSAEAERAVQHDLKREVMTPIDIDGSRLSMMKLYCLNEQTTYMLFKISHLIADGWSLNIFFENLCAVYSGRDLPCPETRPFSDYVRHEQAFLESEVGRRQMDWVTRHERSACRHQLECRYPDAPSISLVEHILINAAVLKKMRAMARAGRASLFHVALTLYHLTVQRYLGSRRSTIGVMFGNRGDLRYTGTAGLFAREQFSTLETGGDEGPSALLAAIRDETGELAARQFCSGGSAAGAAAVEDDTDFLLTYQNFKNGDMAAAGLTFSPYMISETEAACPMTILFFDTPQAMLGTVQYDPVYFSPSDVKQFIREFHEIVHNFTKGVV